MDEGWKRAFRRAHDWSLNDADLTPEQRERELRVWALTRPMSQAETDVRVERRRQRDQWGDDHDDTHDGGELADAAAWLANTDDPDDGDVDDEDLGWAVRLKARHASDRRQQLVIAAALVLAEIDRLDRIASPRGAPPAPDDQGDAAHAERRHEDLGG